MLYFILLIISVALMVAVNVSGWWWRPLAGQNFWKEAGWREYPGVKIKLIAQSMTVFSISVFVAVALSPLYWEFPGTNSVFLIDKNSNVKDKSRFWGFLDVPSHGFSVISLSGSSYWTNTSIQPITTNPKVRHITSHIEVKIGDTQAYLRSWPGTGKNWSEYDFLRQVKSAIYEFHEKNSIELGGFYNPLDSAQQSRFQNLVMSNLGIGLNKNGIKVTQAYFLME